MGLRRLLRWLLGIDDDRCKGCSRLMMAGCVINMDDERRGQESFFGFGARPGYEPIVIRVHGYAPACDGCGKELRWRSTGQIGANIEGVRVEPCSCATKENS
jgi:hypothetical protein